MRHKLPLALVLSIGATLLGGQAAFAQGNTAQVDTPTGGLEEVVVSARKREESLQDVPVAVTAFTAQQIADRQLTSIDDIAKFTPGFVFSKAFGRSGERPVIRGLGSILAGTGAGVESGAAYFIDGVYYAGDVQDLDLNDLDRVEVIRGPQSALYGRNTYSGAVNFITRDPGESFAAKLNANVDPDERAGSFRISGGLGEKVSATLSVRYDKFDGQWTNLATNKTIGQEETKGASLALIIRATDNLKFRVRAQYNEDRDGTRPLFLQSAELNNCYPGTRSLASFANNITPSTNRNQYFCGEIQSPSFIYLNDGPVTGTVIPTPGFPLNTVLTATQAAFLGSSNLGLYDSRQALPFSGVEANRFLASALATWDISGSGYTLTVDGASRTEDRRTGSDSDHSSINLIGNPSTGSPAGFYPVASGSSTTTDATKDYSVEVKLNSPQDQRFRWLVGAYHFEQDRSEFLGDFVAPFGQPKPELLLDIYNTAAFASLEFDITKNFSATVEVRNSKETKSLTNFQSCSGTGSLGAQGSGPGQFCPARGTPGNTTFPVTTPGKVEFKSTTPRATLKWKLNNNFNLFATYAKGNKPGGVNGATAANNGYPNDVFFQPETSKNYELGLKSRWFDNRVVFNATLYKIENEGMQLTTPVQNAMGAVASIVTNQGSGEVKGVEVEAQWKATDHWTLGATYALADTKFTKGCDDFQYQLTSGGGIYLASNPTASTNLTGTGSCSIVGNPYPLAAKNTASLTADFKRPIKDGRYSFYLNGDVSFTDKKAVQVHANPFTPAATLVGLRFGLEGDNWTAGVYARNLTNEDSSPSATRWFHGWLLGSSTFNSTALDPGFIPTIKTLNGQTVGNVSYSLPRAFFGTLRRQRQVGLEFSYKFNGDKAAPPPAKPIDSDGDGVTDDIDRCPATPAGTMVDASGCPLPKDSDGDGVMDPNDKCPETPAGAKVDASGCELDADGDGVVDRLDKCPNTVAGAKVNADGCEMDADGDSVVDRLDKCPDTPKGDRVDYNGCSFKKELQLPGVVFETNKADLLAESSAVLDGVVSTLKRYPELQIEVAGHTDSTGSVPHNAALSKARAETVMKYLTDNGVTNSLKARGYGEKQPVASNKTADGKQANRRVVLRILNN